MFVQLIKTSKEGIKPFCLVDFPADFLRPAKCCGLPGVPIAAHSVPFPGLALSSSTTGLAWASERVFCGDPANAWTWLLGRRA